jgi:uncharacterized protein (TIGR03435 family)
MTRHLLLLVLLASACAVGVRAQSDGSARYEVVSIKRNTSGPGGSSARMLPDGTQILVNMSIWSIINLGAPIPVTETVGYPDWVRTENYDITAKPPQGLTRRETQGMMRNLLIDRMKLAGHIEQREKTTFAMVLARRDGTLGPELQPSTIDCRRKPGDPVAPGPPSAAEIRTSCAMRTGLGFLEAGSVNMDALAGMLRIGAGGEVSNRTGVAGFYSVSLKYAAQGGLSTGPNDLPDFFTAVQEQLGVKLSAEKTMLPVFVVDHIERPTEN